MIKEKLYGNGKKSLMYRMMVNKDGLIEHIEFKAPDGKRLFHGVVDTDKHPLKFSEIKKDKVFEYLIFLMYYPKMILKDMKKVPTDQLQFMLRACEITNEDLVQNVLSLRRQNDKSKRSKKLSRKR
jgi:hypothetical protein